MPLIQAAWPGYPSPHPRWPAPALPADDWNSLVTAYEVDFSARRLPPPFRPDGYVHPRTQEALLFSTAVIPHGQSLVPVDILQLLIRSALDLRSIAPYRSPSSLPLVSQIPVGTPTPPREDPESPLPLSCANQACSNTASAPRPLSCGCLVCPDCSQAPFVDRILADRAPCCLACQTPLEVTIPADRPDCEICDEPLLPFEDFLPPCTCDELHLCRGCMLRALDTDSRCPYCRFPVSV